MKHRKLQIAWSVTWGLLAVLLCVLWVRSYWREDTVAIVEGRGLMAVESSLGQITYSHGGWVDGGPDSKSWRFMSETLVSDKAWPRGVVFFRDDGEVTFSLPYWCPLLVSVAVALAPWLRCRFSLRTLLIATTVIAVVLGIVVWMSRAG